MIKYGIFIQGGESMKKIISLVLATLVCAAVFVGCGSGESTPTSSISIQSNNEYKDLTVGQNVDLEGTLGTESFYTGNSNVFSMYFGNDSIATVTYIGTNLNLKIGDSVRVEGTITESDNSGSKKSIRVQATLVEKVASSNSTTSSNTASNGKLPTTPSSCGVWLAKPDELAEEWEKRLKSGESIDAPGQAPDIKTMYISKIDSNTAIVFDTDTNRYVKDVYVQCKKENGVLTERDKSKVDEYVSAFGQTVDPKFTTESLEEVKANMIISEDGTSGVAIKNNTMFQILVQDESRIMWKISLVK